MRCVDHVDTAYLYPEAVIRRKSKQNISDGFPV